MTLSPDIETYLFADDASYRTTRRCRSSYRGALGSEATSRRVARRCSTRMAGPAHGATASTATSLPQHAHEVARIARGRRRCGSARERPSSNCGRRRRRDPGGGRAQARGGELRSAGRRLLSQGQRPDICRAERACTTGRRRMSTVAFPPPIGHRLAAPLIDCWRAPVRYNAPPAAKRAAPCLSNAPCRSSSRTPPGAIHWRHQ